MQVKLKDLYNTKYFYKSWVLDLNYLFGVCRQLANGDNILYNSPTELHSQVYEAAKRREAILFDVAGIKLGPECAAVIRDEQGRGGKFIDSVDPYQNKVLQDNASRLRVPDMPTEELPPMVAGMDVKTYIQDLKKGVRYTIPVQDFDQYVYMVALVAMIRPKSVLIDITNITRTLFHLVSTNLTIKALSKYSSFWFQNADMGPIGLEFTNGKTVLPGVGEVTISDAANYGELTPSDFGNVRLIDNIDWFGLKELCLANVNNFVARQTYTLEEVLYGYSGN